MESLLYHQSYTVVFSLGWHWLITKRGTVHLSCHFFRSNLCGPVRSRIDEVKKVLELINVSTGVVLMQIFK